MNPKNKLGDDHNRAILEFFREKLAEKPTIADNEAAIREIFFWESADFKQIEMGFCSESWKIGMLEEYYNPCKSNLQSIQINITAQINWTLWFWS